jgi:PST family polysaccharide transporter
MLVFAILNPLGWLLSSLGLVGRTLKIALVLGPLMIMSYLLGLSFGPKGVAFAYSAIMTLWVIPGILWSIHGTVISFGDIVSTVSRPLLSAILASGLAFVAILLVGARMSPLARLVTGNAILFISYFSVLLFAAGQKAFYLDLFRGMIATAPKERKPASVSDV